MTDYLSFRLKDSFIDGYRKSKPRFGFPAGAGNTLGEYAWISKYSRKKPDGTRERFYEGLERVISGMYSIQKSHAIASRIPWNETQAHVSAQEAYDRAFNGKWSPPGRGLWMLGTELVNGRGDSSALQNCGFLSTKDIGTIPDPSLPFCRMMSMSMLGVGVGFDTLGAGEIVLQRPELMQAETPYRFPVHVIEDSREGWCESVGELLRAFFLGEKLPHFNYSAIRPLGSPIRGFGGVASGPAPLVRLHDKIALILDNRQGERITSTDITDLMNLIGKCVVSANVRRSAQIALGLPSDEDFLDLKNWQVNPERNGADGHGHLSNNSVIAEVGGDYSHLASRIALNGEPGLYWRDLAQDYGRLGDPIDGKEYRTAGINPCGEQPLENHELCTLVETFPSNCDDLGDYLRTLKFAYLYAKSVTLLPTQWEETNSVMTRNRRIGTSMSGIVQFAEIHGWAELKTWQDAGYQEVRRWDRLYSEWLGVRESIRVTTVKPSGTVSLLWGVTPGVHWPRESGYYVRTVREAKDSPFAVAMEAAGYPVEPSFSDPDSMVVVTLPVEGPEIRSEQDVSIWEKISLAAQCQRVWSDNSVSATITFRSNETEEIPAVLRAFDGSLKSVSFLPMTEGTYQQAPYQRVSRETWEAMRARITPIDWDFLYGSAELPDAEGELYCANDVCEIPQR
jgi:adenosylcobalamin-dependent ribonucleoside-triphosphate reductase